ncbi:VOC family protein [Chitinophaga sp. 212800010-3]|uniref:VOC family protein n=1 Tax=unclassified Chitinophaga TaxID=2619133 RepID=UPI002DE57F86|nr:3-dmu-9-3-mt domain-containing protein [Chitinophaga sp. 212800010-3]
MAKSMYPCLWFNHQASAAAEFYCTIFPNSRIINDSGMVVNFELNGRYFMGLNGGDQFQFNEACSFVIPCENQDEIDHYWHKLTADGGSEGQCGWCKDKFGFSWQVVPTRLNELMSDPQRAQRVVQAFLKMKKFDIAELENA